MEGVPLLPKDAHGSDDFSRNAQNDNEADIRRRHHLIKTLHLKSKQVDNDHKLLKALYIELKSFKEFTGIAVEAATFSCGSALSLDDILEPLPITQMINQFDPGREEYNPLSFECFLEQVDHYLYWHLGNVMDCGQDLLRHLTKEIGEKLQSMDRWGSVLHVVRTTKIAELEIKLLALGVRAEACAKELRCIATAIPEILKALEDGFLVFIEDAWPGSGQGQESQALAEAFRDAILMFNRAAFEGALKSAVWKKFWIVIDPYWKKREAFRLRMIQEDIVRLQDAVEGLI